MSISWWLKNDKEVVLAAVSQHSDALQYASAELRTTRSTDAESCRSFV